MWHPTPEDVAGTVCVIRRGTVCTSYAWGSVFPGPGEDLPEISTNKPALWLQSYTALLNVYDIHIEPVPIFQNGFKLMTLKWSQYSLQTRHVLPNWYQRVGHVVIYSACNVSGEASKKWKWSQQTSLRWSAVCLRVLTRKPSCIYLFTSPVHHFFMGV